MALTFNVIREKILNFIENTEFQAVTKASFNCDRLDGEQDTMQAVFLVEKPEIYGNKTTNYIVIKWNELDGGNVVSHFNVEISIHSRDIFHCIEIKDGLVNLLDYYSRPCDLDGIKKFRFSNESGIYKDKIEDRYVDNLFFDCRLIQEEIR